MTPVEIMDEVEDLDPDDFDFLMSELAKVAQGRGWSVIR